MLLTFLIASIFFANTLTLGYYFSRLLLHILQLKQKDYGLLDLLILGVIASYVYCNIWSLFSGVNYIKMLPITLLFFYTFYTKKESIIAYNKNLIGYAQKNKFILISVTSILILFIASPPINADSRDYHFTAIYFYEHFKVIKGLANIHGRLAFNPANFIISAGYAFTDLFKQSIYPVNVVLITVFIGWFIKKITTQKSILGYFIGTLTFVYLLRQFFPNLASPSSDTLAVIMAVYIGVSTFEIFSSKTNKTHALLIVILSCLFSVTVKITLFPLLVIIPIIFYGNKALLNRKIFAFIVLVSFFLYIPWLIRNVALSGYLVYPLVQLDWFSFDWKAPKEILALDMYFIKYSPKWVDYNIYKFPINFINWIPTWIIAHAKMHRLLELPFLLAALLSPLVWLAVVFKKIDFKRSIFLVWLVYYFGCFWWLFISPEYRFGYSFLIIAALYPFYILVRIQRFKPLNNVAKLAINTIFVAYLTIAFYKHTKHARYYIQAFKTFWLYPLKDKELLKGVDNVYKIEHYKQFNIYYADMTDCIHFTEPCVGWKYGLVQPRGNNIEDGFRLIKNEVSKNYPFINK